MLRNLPVALVTQITDEFLMITAPWEQQNISVNELLRKQYANYKAADVDSQTADLLGKEMLETISFAIPQYQKDIAQERDIFSQSSVSSLSMKRQDLEKIERRFENWSGDTYPEIVAKFRESAASLKKDIEERLRIGLDSEDQGDILDSLIHALETNNRSSPQDLARSLEESCREKCEVVNRAILDSYLAEFNSIISNTFEEITSSLGVEFSAISRDKEHNFRSNPPDEPGREKSKSGSTRRNGKATPRTFR